MMQEKAPYLEKMLQKIEVENLERGLLCKNGPLIIN